MSIDPGLDSRIAVIEKNWPSAYNQGMKSVRTAIILSLLAPILGAAGCTFKANTNVNTAKAAESNSESNSAKTNVEELGMLINVPYETEDIVWKEIVPKKKLIAVIRLSPNDAAKVVSEIQAIEPPQNVALQSESWFPDELIAQSDLSGDDTLKGIAYSARPFLQEPFSEGRVVRIEGTDYFVIEVNAK